MNKGKSYLVSIKRANAVRRAARSVLRAFNKMPRLEGRRNARAFVRDSGAAAAVEFALIALVSLELLTETMQAGLYFYTSAGLERATSKSARQILTGSVNNAGYTAAQFLTNVVCPYIGATNLSCTNVISNVQTVSEAVSPGGYYTLVNAGQTALVRPPLNNQQTSYCTGGAQSYVVVQLLYAMPVFSPIWRAFATTFNGQASYILQSTATFRNEPFTAGSQNC